MQNAEFRDTFIKRFKALLATTFAADNLQATFAELLRDYAEVLPLERQRIDYTAPWLLDEKVELRWTLDQQAELNSRETDFSYDERMAEIQEFVVERPGFVADLLRKHLGGSEP